MPIPSMYPRPIPTGSNTRRSAHKPIQGARPGSSVPRKAIMSLDKVDWKAELLNSDYTPRSLPGQGSIRIIDASTLSSQRAEPATDVREIDLEGLIAEGKDKGKREKRVTTATSLGFDFIPNPTILSLPDTSSAHKTTSYTPISYAKTASHGRISPALSNTPSTPALLPTREREASIEEDDDIDEWEHLSTISRGDDEEATGNADEDDDDSQSEEDVIVLGELELEDELDLADHRRALRHAAKRTEGFTDDKAKASVGSKMRVGQGLAKRGVSYAAALRQK